MQCVRFGPYLADVACKKAASGNVESVFSGASQFTEEAPLTGARFLAYLIKLHYNWKYSFLHPTDEEIIERYDHKFRPTVVAKRAAAAAKRPAAPDAAPPAAAPAPAPAADAEAAAAGGVVAGPSGA